MKTFLLKHKWTIIFWLVLLALMLYFAPRQHRYYLDSDIKIFKQTYFTSILAWTGLVVAVLIFLIVLVRSKSIKQSGISFIYASVMLAFFLFIFQDLILGTSLFINRQFKRDTLQKSYVVSYLAGTDQVKDNFFPYDLSTKQPSVERKLINRIYNSSLRQNDTITIQVDKGLLGIPFHSTPLDSE